MSAGRQSHLGGLVAVLAVIAYDGLAHYVSAVPGAAAWAAGISVLPGFALAIGLARARGGRIAAFAAAAGLVLLAALLWPTLRHNLPWLYLIQYLSTNFALGLYFGRSLRAGQTPACTHFASLVHRGMTPTLARYTRQVTVAWTAFFAGSALLSTLLFAFAPVAVWSFFANVLYLPSVVLTFVVEALLRRVVLPAGERMGMLDAVRAWRSATVSTATAAKGPP
jgi:uncharacterized membrane protein